MTDHQLKLKSMKQVLQLLEKDRKPEKLLRQWVKLPDQSDKDIESLLKEVLKK